MSTRTLRHWCAQAGAPPGRGPGRPPRPALEWRAVLRDVQAAQGVCGEVGWRPLYALLGATWSTDAVQRALAWDKARRRSASRQVAARRALHTAVHHPGAVWSLDGTHLGRSAGGHVVEGQVLKDNSSRLVLAADLGGPVVGRDAVALLEAARGVHGDVPLALLTDNGSPYVGHEVEAWLAAHRVVHVRSVPHTPQHNAACERAHREVKAETGLGKGVRIGDLAPVGDALSVALARLNARPRKILGWRSARQAHESGTRRYTARLREELYAATRCAVQAALQDAGSARARRSAERRAALATLESYGIITQTRGSDDKCPVKPEAIT